MPDVMRIPSLRLTDIDGTPDIQGVERIYLTNGFLSDMGGGNALLSMSGSAGGSALTVRDIDGTPLVANVNTIQVTNGVLTDNGGGNVTIAIGGGGAPSTAEYWVETADAGLSAEVVVGTTGITTAAYASRQAAAKAGRLFLPSNGFVLERDSGSAWAPWGPIYPLTAPLDGDFAWINQGGASVATTNGGIYLLAPATAGVSMRIRKKAAPATPYTITAALLPLFGRVEGSTNPLIGLCWREVATGEVVRFGFYQSAAGTFRVQHAKVDSPTAFNASYFDELYAAQSFSPMWLRMTDDGANRTLHLSRDGQNFIQIHTIGRTDFLTADEVGWFVEAGSATYDAGATLISWRQT